MARVKKITTSENESELMARTAAEFILEKKANDILVLDVRKLTDMTDYFVICSTDSDTQLKAVAGNVLDHFAELGEKPFKTEGWSSGQWIILDFYNIVIHIFYKEAREFYKLEKLWADAVIEVVNDEVKVSKVTKPRAIKLVENIESIDEKVKVVKPKTVRVKKEKIEKKETE
ncbi:MAG: ribosome silencing factor [Candidatus Kapaibacterium sp.]